MTPGAAMGAVGAGLTAASVLWITVGSHGFYARLDNLPAPSRPAVVDAAPSSAAVFPDRFFTPVPEPSVRLAGVSSVNGRPAALIAINQEPARWLSRGQSAGGMTIADIRAGQVVFDTASGRYTVALGETTRPISDQTVKPSAP